ncbi:MAG: T9SS type A sorting domain-containing protein, partial [bacterium]
LHGIEIIQDSSNYIRCEFLVYGGAYNYYLQAFDNTGAAANFDFNSTGMPPIGTAPIYMRINRTGTTFTQYWSTDAGVVWTQAGQITHTLNVDSMGVYAGNADPGGGPSAFVGLIDFFKKTPDTPVQLANFTASVINENRVRLNWTTVSETNNYGFYVQRSVGVTSNFQRIEGSFIAGHGTTIDPHSYTYTDVAPAGSIHYRLEQIDLDGSTHYSESVQATILTSTAEGALFPKEFTLRQNYPNPFNPSTIIKYELPKESRVSLEIYNLIGQKVATLVEGMKPAGSHQVSFNASGFTSGVYMYKLSAGNQVFTKKMVLMK